MATTITQEEETRLVQAALAGDDTAFTAIYTQFEAVARRAVFGVVPQDDVDDVVQETFLLVHRKLDTFQADARLSTWIHRIAFNVALTAIRKARSDRADQMVSIDETFEGNDGEALPGFELGYEDRTIETNAVRDLVESAVVMLTATEQETIALILEGYGPTEIAEIKSVSIAAAKSMMWRAKRGLKSAIENLQRRSRSRVHRKPAPVTVHLLIDTKDIDRYVDTLMKAKSMALDTETTTGQWAVAVA